MYVQINVIVVLAQVAIVAGNVRLYMVTKVAIVAVIITNWPAVPAEVAMDVVDALVNATFMMALLAIALQITKNIM
jgi:hypothetical protein